MIINNKESGLYLHIPFCHHKCAYCDFFSVTDFANLDNYLDALQKEISMSGEQWKEHRFTSVYFGGGTPSILTPESIDFILSELKQIFEISSQAEITLEANPGTLAYDKAKGYLYSGINRISLGVQSFIENELNTLDRIHDVKDVFNSFADLRKAGFQNISLDLISAIPGQEKVNLSRNLEEAIDLNPEHLSIYTLIIEPNTPFATLMKNGKIKTIEDDKESELFRHTVDTLENSGFDWYEVSNFARSEALQSQHNNKYWNMVPYLGLGPSAHSFDGKARWGNPRSVSKYIEALLQGKLPMTKKETLDRETLMTEFAFLGLRQRKGLNKANFLNLFDCEFDEVFVSFIDKFNNSKWLLMDGEHISLSKEGMLLADEISTYLKVDNKCATY